MKTPIQVFFVDHSFVALGSWIHERKKTFFLWSRFSLVRVRSVWKCSSPAHNQRMRRSPLSRREGVICWKMDSATSPSAPRKMTGWGNTVKSESSRNRETNHREKPTIPIKKGTGAMCMGFWLMMGTLASDWFMCWLFNKCSSNRVVCSWTL